MVSVALFAVTRHWRSVRGSIELESFFVLCCRRRKNKFYAVPFLKTGESRGKHQKEIDERRRINRKFNGRPFPSHTWSCDVIYQAQDHKIDSKLKALPKTTQRINSWLNLLERFSMKIIWGENFLFMLICVSAQHMHSTFFYTKLIKEKTTAVLKPPSGFTGKKVSVDTHTSGSCLVEIQP